MGLSRNVSIVRRSIRLRIPPWSRHAICAAGTVVVLGAISPPLLHAQDLVALAAPVLERTAGSTGATTQPAEKRPDFHRIDLHSVPAQRAPEPFTLRDFSLGYRAAPFTLGLAEIGPDPVDCSLVTTAPAAGRTAGGRACAQPIRVNLLWW